MILCQADLGSLAIGYHPIGQYARSLEAQNTEAQKASTAPMTSFLLGSLACCAYKHHVT
jgi:hypothetical protein